MDSLVKTEAGKEIRIRESPRTPGIFWVESAEHPSGACRVYGWLQFVGREWRVWGEGDDGETITARFPKSKHIQAISWLVKFAAR